MSEKRNFSCCNESLKNIKTLKSQNVHWGIEKSLWLVFFVRFACFFKFLLFFLKRFDWIFDSYAETGIPNHSKILELAQYSPFADYVIKVRNKFMNSFEAHKQEFGGIDGEALFVGTVLHSLDHSVVVELMPPTHPWYSNF